MKKQLLFINLGLVVFASSFASIPLFPAVFLNKIKPSKIDKQQTQKAHEGYANFSGHWTGTCDIDPDEKIDMMVDQSTDSSSIMFDNTVFPIDAISTNGFNGNFATENNMIHLRWNQDGQQILGSTLSYSKVGNMAHGDVVAMVGKFNLFLENGQLIVSNSFYDFTDGTLNGNLSVRCVYNKA